MTDVTVSELRQSIGIAASSEKNWVKENPIAVGESKIINLPRAFSDQISYITKISSKHLIIPLEGALQGWDLERHTPAGKYEMNADTLIVDLVLDGCSRSLFCLTSDVVPVRRLDGFGIHVSLFLIRVGIPEPGSTQELDFEETARMTLTLPFSSEIYFLNASERMFCSVFSCSPKQTTGIWVVLDWDTEEAVMFDTGIPYSYGKVRVSLSAERDFLVVYSENKDCVFRRWYSLMDVPRSSQPWSALEFVSTNAQQPAKSEISKWDNAFKLLSQPGSAPYVFWQLHQNPCPPSLGIPDRFSTIILYASLSDLDSSLKTWRIVQHYSDQNGPCSPARALITLSYPVLSPNEPSEHYMPILCLSFNHIGWIEEIKAEDGNKRVFKLLTLPDPGTTHRGDLTSTARALDIPSEELEDVLHVLLDATQGLIIAATFSNVLRVYHY
ncbi:hypothetical protein EW145_g3152 [Phellinidium pouzarii]|uniref:Uncharacterized protein n=1 Tax=Phellinidium pouzarii TaxID=167371 RepID=A0A4S4LA44_9AGAM|nr:hypothetical protein EW145_g3152 [Phellinidium pouzarii]